MFSRSSALFITSLSLLLAGCLLNIHTQAQAPPARSPKAIFGCKATNFPVDEVHHFADGHIVLEEADDWIVDCRITIGAETVWTGTLPLAHPTGYEEAMAAINKFRKEEAPKIVKEKSKK